MQIRELKRKEREYELGYRYEVKKETDSTPNIILCHTLEDAEICVGAEIHSYYCVYQRYVDGNGETIKISTILATDKPDNIYNECPNFDEYYDYFNTYTEAKALWDDFKALKNKK